MWLYGSAGVFFFFFQAEDGIRDVAVTGVQTCALPISGPARGRRWESLRDRCEGDPVEWHGPVLPGAGAHAWLPVERGLRVDLRGGEARHPRLGDGRVAGRAREPPRARRDEPALDRAAGAGGLAPAAPRAPAGARPPAPPPLHRRHGPSRGPP